MHVIWLADFSKEPDTSLGLIDPILEQAGASHVLAIIAQCVCRSHVLRQSIIICPQFRQHIEWRHFADAVKTAKRP